MHAAVPILLLLVALVPRVAHAQAGLSPCDPGTYLPASGSSCQSCEAGFYCRGDGSKTQCSSNAVSPNGASSCQSCGSGLVASADRKSCVSESSSNNLSPFSNALYSGVFICALVLPLVACLYSNARRRRAAAAARAAAQASRAAAAAAAAAHVNFRANGTMILLGGGEMGTDLRPRGLPPKLAALLVIEPYVATPSVKVVDKLSARGEKESAARPAEWTEFGTPPAAAGAALPGSCAEKEDVTEVVVTPPVVPSTSAAAASTSSIEECVVCLMEYTHGDRLVVLPCGHKFHAHTCGLKWLASDSRCPNCRADTFALLSSLAVALGTDV